jgi:demethylmenaquinone methyltransferase/2-methoxy-6-polyprenyl-1,4-benzoquinol methylase
VTAQTLPPPEHKAAAVEAMFDRIAPRYDLVNQILTFGLDAAWRRRAVALLGLPRGSRVGDLACGTGAFCVALERAGYAAIGFDIAQGMLDRARTTAPLVRADILELPLANGSLDGVTCGWALRNVTDIDRCFAEMSRVLRPGGRAAILEIAAPPNPLLRAAHGLYFNHVVPMVGGVLSDRAAYHYLPNSAAYLPPGDELSRRLAAAGFRRVHRRLLGFGATQLLTGTRA